MFPEDAADPDPHAPDRHIPVISISSATTSENTSRHQQQQQQQISINLWPPVSQYSADMAAHAERLMLEGLSRHQFVHAASNAGGRDEQLLLQQPPPAFVSSSSSPSSAAEASMLENTLLPLSMPGEQLYSEPFLRSFSKGGQFPLHPRMYENIHANQEHLHFPSLNNFGLSRSLENLGRSVGAAGGTNESTVPASAAAAARYEEACTPRPRWCPTQEQIQILESLFNSGTTTPSRDMIVDIAAQLRKYGSIAEANVFYWFQNRKARAKRKLQPPPLPSHAPAGSNNEERSSSDHHAEGGGGGSSSSATALAAGESHSSKTRRVSLKPAASSPMSSTSPPLTTELACSTMTAAPLQQQQQLPSPMLNPPHQETLLVPNRIISNPPHQDNQAALLSWPHQHLGSRMEEGVEIGGSSLHGCYLHMGLSLFRSPSPGQHGNLQLIDPRISLSLAPPAQQHQQLPPQPAARGQPAAVLNYATPPDHQFLQATSKGIVLMDPRNSLRENSMFDASGTSSVDSAFFSHVETSRSLSMSGVECNQLGEPLPQSSLPLARTGDDQATRLSVPSLPDGEDHLQLWEELDPTNNLGWGGHNQH